MSDPRPAEREAATTTGLTAAGELGAPARVLVVDDEPALRRSLARLLQAHRFDVLTAEDGPAAFTLLATTRVDVVLLDLLMPAMSGMEVLDRVKKEHPAVEVIMMTAFGDVDAAVAAVRAGAYGFLTKPLAADASIALTLGQAVEHKCLVERARSLEERLGQQQTSGELIGSSARMQEVHRVALGVASTASTVLLLGENGTGKELVARAIHQHSARAGRPLFAVDCGAIPDTLLDAELFGSVRGAAPGALDRPGLFELADGGTLFLDEIGALPLGVQVKLLRALAQGKSKRVGATEEKLVDVRVIAATNVDLRARIASGAFREDLFYRLNVIPIHLPSLRMRKDDIPLLAYHFLQRYARRAGRDVKRISVEAMRLLRDEEWPGNVRELESAIEHAVVMARGEAILPTDLPFAHERSAAEAHGTASFFAGDLAELPYTDAKERATHAFDVSYLERVMKRTGSNVSEAARQAGMDRSNFRRLLKKARGGKGDADE